MLNLISEIKFVSLLRQTCNRLKSRVYHFIASPPNQLGYMGVKFKKELYYLPKNHILGPNFAFIKNKLIIQKKRWIK